MTDRQQGTRNPDRGATATEYALVLGLVALVIAGAVAALGQDVAGLFSTPLTGL